VDSSRCRWPQVSAHAERRGILATSSWVPSRAGHDTDRGDLFRSNDVHDLIGCERHGCLIARRSQLSVPESALTCSGERCRWRLEMPIGTGRERVSPTPRPRDSTPLLPPLPTAGVADGVAARLPRRGSRESIQRLWRDGEAPPASNRRYPQRLAGSAPAGLDDGQTVRVGPARSGAARLRWRRALHPDHRVRDQGRASVRLPSSGRCRARNSGSLAMPRTSLSASGPVRCATAARRGCSRTGARERRGASRGGSR
jgi:hypothetical protein